MFPMQPSHPAVNSKTQTQNICPAYTCRFNFLRVLLERSDFELRDLLYPKTVNMVI